MRHGLAVAVLVIAAASLFAHDPIATKVTWEREIAPIVQARCVSCHSPGGRAPMPLTTYDEARPWARAIREEVLARRMPRWSVVRGYGDFINDPSLSPFEIALITAWADGGAPASLKTPTADKRSLSALVSPPARAIPVALSAVTLPCTSQRLRLGRLVAVKPVLAAGGTLQLTLGYASGLEEPLIRIRDFDPAFAETYWLRNPVAVGRGMRLLVAPRTGDLAPCTVTLTFVK